MNINTKHANEFEAKGPARPWGQKILRDKALELHRSGAVAPSALMGNLMAAAASPILDVERLAAQSRPMSAEANRVIASALQRSRLPNADLGAILYELIDLVWIGKKYPEPEFVAKSAYDKRRDGGVRGTTGAERQAGGKNPQGKTQAAAAPASVKAPIIVRRAAKLSQSPS